MYQLSNEFITVTIAAKGAELQSICSNQNPLEYMWSGDPFFWGKKSPVLFPIVGGLKNNTYQFNGKHYPLSRHGFAREKIFAVAEQSSNSITFTLSDDEETLKVYPFHFRFSIRYHLQNNSVTVTYLVENTGTEPMYFSVGAHPAFAVPLVKGTAYTDYFLQFDQKETAGKWPLSAEGLIQTAPVEYLQQSDILPLTKELFYGDALVFKNLASTSISVLSRLTKHGVKLSFADFPFMGIWSARNADFVCIEPWCGIADSENASGNITEKEGINALSAKEKFSRSWSVEVF